MTDVVVTGSDVIDHYNYFCWPDVKPIKFCFFLVLMLLTNCNRGIKLQPKECITSYDVSALFTSVPIESAITIIRNKLELDPELHQRTTMKVEHIISLLEFCLKTTYFQFQGRFYEQLHGAAMGSPISPIVANLYMEDFETKAVSSAVHPPSTWKRFVDHTFVVIESSRKAEFLDHINNLDPQHPIHNRGC